MPLLNTYRKYCLLFCLPFLFQEGVQAVVVPTAPVVIVPPGPPVTGVVQQHADAYLAALRSTPGALSALQALSGVILPATGTLTPAQNQALIDQLFKADGTTSVAYNTPVQAAQALPPGATYLQTLRQTSGALGALQTLTGQTLPASGILAGPQIDFLFTQLFDVNGNPAPAFSQPVLAAQATVHAANYLQTLRQTSGALNALQTLSGIALPASGPLNATQIQFLFTQLFDASGTTTTAYNQPAQAAQATIHAATYLQVLRQTPGALGAIQTLSGQGFPASGPLSAAQIQFLFTQLFDASGNPTVAYNNPVQAAQATIHAANYLQVLRQTPGAIGALQSLTGQSFPASGPLTANQIQFLFTQLFDASGNPTLAYDQPAKAAAITVQAGTYLQVLRQTPGALAGLQILTGQSLPASGGLTSTQIQFLFTQLFDASGNLTLAATQPAKAAQGVAAAGAYLQALRQTPGALNGLQSLTGLSFPASGPLTPAQIESLFTQLFDAGGNPTAAYKQPVQAAQAVASAATYLQTLRTTPGGLAALQNLTGQTLPSSGVLTQAQILFLFTQLFDANGNTTPAYNSPAQAAIDLIHGSDYLNALRNNPKAMAALQNLTGQTLPLSGPLSNDQISLLFKQLFDSTGARTPAYNNPTQAAIDLIHGSDYLDALRKDPKALAALQNLTGQALPASGPLTPAQISLLFKQLFDSTGAKTPAYNNPTQAATDLVHASDYLNALRKDPNALAALQNLTGQSLPATGALTPEQISLLFKQLFNEDGTHGAAYDNPTQAAIDLIHGSDYLNALRKDPKALAAMQNLLGQALPATGALTVEQIALLFKQLFNEDGTHTPGYDNPTQAATDLVHASDYLDALRKDPNALAAMKNLLGQTLPTTGPLTLAQISLLFKQIFNEDGSHAPAYDNPTQAATDLVHGSDYLDALRNNPNALAALNNLLGKTLPATGPLSIDQISLLFKQLFDSTGAHTAAYDTPTQAATDLVHGSDYLNALRNTPGALAAMQNLLGQTLPSAGALTIDQIALLFKQLFNEDGTHTAAYKGPTQAALDLVHGSDYLNALRNTPGALAALQTLLGKTLPASGSLSNADLELLFQQLFSSDGSQTSAYDHPMDAAQTLVNGVAYLQALRNTPGALDALFSITGLSFPASGPLSDTQIGFLFNQLFDADKKPTLAFSKPDQAAQAVLRALAYLTALRQTPGALEALEFLTGQILPASGFLAGQQVVYLFSQLFEQDGKTTSAYNDPVAAAKALVQAAAYMKALRDTPGALSALKEITGSVLPPSGPLTKTQVKFLFTLLFDKDGKPTAAYKDPVTAAQDLSKSQTNSWKGILLGIAVLGGLGMGELLSKSGVLPKSLAIGVGVAVAGAIVAIILHPKSGPATQNSSSTNNSTITPIATPVFSMASPITPSIPPQAMSVSRVRSSPTATSPLATSVSQLTIVDPAARIVGSHSPSQAYVPPVIPGQDVTDQNPESVKAYYAQGRWLATANGGHVSPVVAQTAAEYAGAANKNVGVIAVPHSNPINLNQ